MELLQKIARLYTKSFSDNTKSYTVDTYWPCSRTTAQHVQPVLHADFWANGWRSLKAMNILTSNRDTKFSSKTAGTQTYPIILAISYNI